MDEPNKKTTAAEESKKALERGKEAIEVQENLTNNKSTEDKKTDAAKDAEAWHNEG